MTRTAQLSSWPARGRMSSMLMRSSVYGDHVGGDNQIFKLSECDDFFLSNSCLSLTCVKVNSLNDIDIAGWSWPPPPPSTLPLQRARVDPRLRLDQQQVSHECQRGVYHFHPDDHLAALYSTHGQVEFARAYRLTMTSIEPVSFSVPRVKAACFQVQYSSI